VFDLRSNLSYRPSPTTLIKEQGRLLPTTSRTTTSRDPSGRIDPCSSGAGTSATGSPDAPKGASLREYDTLPTFIRVAPLLEPGEFGVPENLTGAPVEIEPESDARSAEVAHAS
jgi:hypothetical protein